MAAHRALARKLALLALAFALSLSVLPSTVLAYDNLSAHPKINSEAVARYLARAKSDEWLSGTSLDGAPALGLAVVENGMLAIREEARQMKVADWLAHGGTSADEPELPASFRHFYDPLRLAKVAYLTDHIDDLLEFGAGLGGVAVSGVGYFVPLPDTSNPRTNAKSWALDHPDNRFTFAKAIEYYTAALAKQQQLSDGEFGTPMGTNPAYGMAWRAVGETMHLMADMTVPAHVRNDSHPYVPAQGRKLGNPDPYESTISAEEVANFANGAPASSINYETEDVYDLFEATALWTNENFFSIDTVPMPGSETTQNGQPPYPSPGLAWSEPAGFTTDTSRYALREVDGRTLPIIRRSMLDSLGMINKKWMTYLETGDLADLWVPPQVFTMDLVVLNAQRSILIPTAIEASSRVIDAFLPRLKAELVAEPSSATKVAISGRLAHKPTLMWPDEPDINNGAYLEYVPAGFNDVHRIWLPATAFLDGNRIEYELEAEPGALISLHWDLGGYLVSADRVVIRGVDLKVLPERLGDIYDGDETFFEAELSDIPKSMPRIAVEWSFGDGTDPAAASLAVAGGAASHDTSHAYAKPGDYTLRVRAINPANNEILAEVTRSVKVQQRQISVQIYPRGLTGQVGQTLEASALPSNSQYRYEWVFGDGQRTSKAESVVRHAWAKKGTYELTVLLYRASDSGQAAPLAQDKIKVEIGDPPGTGTDPGTGPAKVYAWKLVEIVDYPNKPVIPATEYWQLEHSYARASYSTKIWHKDAQTDFAYGARAQWSEPPSVIKAGEKVSLQATLSETANTHRANSFGASTYADFSRPETGLGSRGPETVYFVLPDGATDSIAIRDAGASSASGTFTAVAPGGKEGGRIAIRLTYYMTTAMGTYYVYEWQPY